MKKLFLSIMILCSVINPIFGMEDDEAQQDAPGEASGQAVCEETSAASEEILEESALLAIARHVLPENSHLIRSIVCSWFEQYPNGTYREFLDEYTQRRSFPVQLLPAIRAGFELIRLLRQSNMIINEIVRYDYRDPGLYGNFSGIPRDLQYDRRVIFELCSSSSRYWPFTGCDYTNPYTYRAERVDGEKQHLSNIDACFNAMIDQEQQPVLLGIVIWHPDHHSDNFCANKKKLFEAVQAAQRPHHTVAVLLVNGDTRHVIIAYRGVVVVIPSIVVPARAPNGQCQQIAQEAIARAIDHQPVFRTILEAIQYLEGSDS